MENSSLIRFKRLCICIPGARISPNLYLFSQQNKQSLCATYHFLAPSQIKLPLPNLIFLHSSSCAQHERNKSTDPMSSVDQLTITANTRPTIRYILQHLGHATSNSTLVNNSNTIDLGHTCHCQTVDKHGCFTPLSWVWCTIPIERLFQAWLLR